jgi:hypothetical protein
MGICGNSRSKRNNEIIKKTPSNTKKVKKNNNDIKGNNENQRPLTRKKSLNNPKNIGKSKNISQNPHGIYALPAECIPFPKGEHYYQLINDSNIGGGNTIEKNNSLSEKIELFFSLDNVCNPMDDHSFGISIINNKQIGTKTFLGSLQDAKGDKIEFGESFIVDFFFEREQIIIIEPKINGKKTGQKEEFVLCKLMTNKDSKLKVKIESVGTLEVNYRKLKNKDKELINEISCFQFNISLNNKIFENSDNLENIYYVIRNIKDGKKRRPVYKSHEYNFEYKQKK